MLADPRYTILSLLDDGGMGAVYCAEEVDLRRIVAIKVLNPEYAAHAGFVERFTRSARFQLRCRHRNVAAVFELGESGGHRFLVMEFVDRPDLRRHLAREGPLPLRALARVGRDVALALGGVAASNMAHLSVRPEHVVLDQKGGAKLVGFMRALPLDAIRMSRAPAAPADGYTAPEEVLRVGPPTAKCDLYSLGVVLREMLTGRGPLDEPPVTPRALRAAAPAVLVDLILGLVDPDPLGRPDHALVASVLGELGR